MLTRLRRNLLGVRHAYLSPIDRQRASVLLLVNWAITAAAAAWFLFVLVTFLVSQNPETLPSLLFTGPTILLSLLIYFQIQTGRLKWAIWLFVLLLTGNVIALTILRDPERAIHGTAVIALALPLVAAGVLLKRRGMLLVTLVLISMALYGGFTQFQSSTDIVYNPSQNAVIDIGMVLISLSLILAFQVVFAGNLERIASESLADVRQRQRITEFGIELGGMDSEEPILARALGMIHNEFGYLFGQAYLLDEEGRFSGLARAGASAAEINLRSNPVVSEANVIREAARTGRPVLVSNEDPLGRRAHLLAAASYGIAVPVIHHGRTLAVLDVQSDYPFSSDKIRALELLTDQVAVALAHARQMNDLQRNLREQAAFNARLQQHLSEFQQRERRGLASLWGSYLEGRGKTAIGYDIEPGSSPTPIPAHDLPETLATALRSGAIQVETSGEEQIVNVPINFRDQTLGAMSFAIPKDQVLSERQVEMAKIVADRLALALENTRLFEQSRAQAVRERKASEINTALIGATDVRTVLDMAAANFHEALGAIHTRIYIQPGALSEPLVETQETWS